MTIAPNSLDIKISKETLSDQLEVDVLALATFGPGMYSRAAFRLREGMAHEGELSFVAKINGVLVGSVRLTKICVGETPSLILGPLMISENHRNLGLGRELMQRAIKAANASEHETIILVGDFAYYRKFGFKRVPNGSLTLPGPADPARILVCELSHGAAENLNGRVTKFFNDGF